MSGIGNILDLALDWNELIRRAKEENVVPLLFKSLKTLKEKVPESEFELLRKYYTNNSIRNMRNFSRLSPLLKAFERESLRVSLIKGARLAETIYKDWGLRRFDDYDFMVHPEEIQALHEILAKQGFWTDIHTRFAPNSKLIMQHGFYKDNVRVDFSFDFFSFCFDCRNLILDVVDICL